MLQKLNYDNFENWEKLECHLLNFNLNLSTNTKPSLRWPSIRKETQLIVACFFIKPADIQEPHNLFFAGCPDRRGHFLSSVDGQQMSSFSRRSLLSSVCWYLHHAGPHTHFMATTVIQVSLSKKHTACGMASSAYLQWDFHQEENYRFISPSLSQVRKQTPDRCSSWQNCP